MKITCKALDNKTIWNRFIDKHSPQSLFQRFEWGQVQELSRCPLYRYGMYDGSTLVGLIQAAIIPTKRGSFMHVRHGPVLKTWDSTYLHVFFSAVTPIARKHNALFIRISPLIEKTAHNEQALKDNACIPASIHSMDGEFCLVLPLTKPEDELLSSMRKTTRYEIRHAEKLGITVNESKNVNDVDKFLQLYNETSKRHGFVEHKGICEEVEVFLKDNACSLFFAMHKGKLIASAIILYAGNQAIYHHGASQVSNIPASYAIQWKAIREANNRGLMYYNFWGVSPIKESNHPWAGLSLFKRGFGGVEVSYMHAHDYVLSPLYYAFKATEIIRKTIKGYT